MVRKQVKAKPNSKKQEIIAESDGSLTAYLKSSPVDGKANKELVQLLATFFGVSRSSVVIKTGSSSRTKLVEIDLDEV